MLVHEVMTRRPVTVRSDTSTKDALRLLDKHGVTSLPVVNHDGRIVGVVSEADLLRDAVLSDGRAHMIPEPGHGPAHLDHVADVMNRHPVTVLLNDDLADAVELLTSTVIKSLPVVDDRGRVVGMLSRRDIVHILAREDDEIERELGELFRSFGVDWLVEVRDGVATVEGPVGAKACAMAETAAATVPGVVAVTVVGQ